MIKYTKIVKENIQLQIYLELNYNFNKSIPCDNIHKKYISYLSQIQMNSKFTKKHDITKTGFTLQLKTQHLYQCRQSLCSYLQNTTFILTQANQYIIKMLLNFTYI